MFFLLKGRSLRRRERVVLQIVSEELETANEYSGRHGTTRKLRDPAKNGERDGSFFSSSTVHNDHRRTRQQPVTIEKHRERGDYEVEFVSYVHASLRAQLLHVNFEYLRRARVDSPYYSPVGEVKCVSRQSFRTSAC